MYSPSEKRFDLDQFTNSLERIITVTATPPKELIWLLREKTLIPDTNILIDNKLSSILLREQIEYNLLSYKIDIPKVVLFEIKRMADDRHNKFRQKIGNMGMEEVGKLRALADAAIIILEFSGDPPQYDLPNVLRDEFILEEVTRQGDTLLTGDEKFLIII